MDHGLHCLPFSQPLLGISPIVEWICLNFRRRINLLLDNPMLYLTLSMLGADSADNELVIHVFFLFFLENRIWHFMQIVSLGDNLHEVLDLFFPKETICMKCLILFSRKNKKKIFQNVLCWNFYPACKMLKCVWLVVCHKYLDTLTRCHTKSSSQFSFLYMCLKLLGEFYGVLSGPTLFA